MCWFSGDASMPEKKNVCPNAVVCFCFCFSSLLAHHLRCDLVWSSLYLFASLWDVIIFVEVAPAYCRRSVSLIVIGASASHPLTRHFRNPHLTDSTRWPGELHQAQAQRRIRTLPCWVRTSRTMVPSRQRLDDLSTCEMGPQHLERACRVHLEIGDGERVVGDIDHLPRATGSKGWMFEFGEGIHSSLGSDRSRGS